MGAKFNSGLNAVTVYAETLLGKSLLTFLMQSQLTYFSALPATCVFV